jgi:hypothetical protein
LHNCLASSPATPRWFCLKFVYHRTVRRYNTDRPDSRYFAIFYSPCITPDCLVIVNGQSGELVLSSPATPPDCLVIVDGQSGELVLSSPATPPDCLFFTARQSGVHAPLPPPPPRAPPASSPPSSPPRRRLRSRPVSYETVPCPTMPLRALRSRSVHYEAVAMAGRHCLSAKLSPAMEATVRHAFFSLMSR